ncbi:DnaJ domain-containing protein [bacterium]|nr:DnaJ domain-containing protein [bacterium]
MSIADRIAGIAKSYYHTAKDELEDGFEDLSNLYERGELASEIKKRVSAFKKSSAKTEEDDLSPEEVEQILHDMKYDHQQTSHPKKKKTSSKLDKAYARLNVNANTHIDLVEKAYKKAMKQYHPDLFATDPSKLDAATKVAQMIAEAYDTIKNSKK